ncbi:MAG: glycosyltransferase family 2 protein [Gammaproteobacteria bacterium]|nr:glycosyltransferase family 2 protein [Gammaproteobacteria bacterium]
MINATEKKLPISVFIITLNEERNIKRLLESCRDMDEIILVDSGSTDKTLEIAANYDVKISHNDWPGYAKQKAYAMSLCSHEWVLNLDADEELTPELIKKFAKIVKENKYDSVRCQRNDIFMGKRLSSFTKKPNNCRLYKKATASFDLSRFAHERADIKGSQVFIREAFNHYGYADIKTLTEKNNLYSSFKAEEKYSKNKKPSLLKLLLIFPAIFIKSYIFQRHIFSGKRGFILSVLTAYYLFIKEAKLFELYSNDRKEATYE